MRPLVALLLFLLLTASSASSQIGLYTTLDGGNDNCSAIAWNGISEVYIVVTGEWRGARFSIQSDCAGPIQIDPLNGATITGYFQEGIEMTFPCTPDLRAVARVDVYGLIPCCEFRLSPHPAAGVVELTDCDAHATPAQWSAHVHVGSVGYPGECDNVPVVSPPPRNPFPAHDATNVQLAPTLSWTIDSPYGNCGDISGRRDWLYFGTSPNPPLIAEELAGEFAVGPLQPATTYYWRVKVHNYGPETIGPVWSFRTETPLANEPTTWGRVKALYR